MREVDNSATLSNVQEYIGPIMAACRRRSGLSQEELSETLYCSRSLISKIEKHKQLPEMKFVLAWMEATKSKDAVVAILYGEQGVRWIINQLQEEGFWQEGIL